MGIENAHAGYPLSCTQCHGGDPESQLKEGAHVAITQPFLLERAGYIKNLSVNELDDVDPGVLRFKNPGDYRVAHISCGSSSSANTGSGCHQKKVDTAKRSIMTTFAGHFGPARFQAGMQDQVAQYASRAIETLYPNQPIPAGAVPSLKQAHPPADDAPRDEIATAMDHYLTKNCTRCHQASFGANDAPGNFRSSGCTSCHMVYANDGKSDSADPVAIRNRAPHPVRHELTLDIPSSQCEHCHYQGARIGLRYRGVMEWGFSDQTPPFDNIGESLHGHQPEFYLQDAEAYPPDLHHTAGLACADCHVGRDVHGDGNLYSNAKLQVSIRCENCHGNIDASITPGKATAPLLPGGLASPECQPETTAENSAEFLNCNGDPIRNLQRSEDGEITLRLHSGGTRPVSQVHDILESDQASAAMRRAMGRNSTTGASHTEQMECHTCHTHSRQYCFGCHVTMDYSVQRKDHLTGVTTFGAEYVERSNTSIDLYFLGKNSRGKISSLCPSMQVFMSATERDEVGERISLFENRARTTQSGKVGFNWAADAPHGTSSRPKACNVCHADAADGCSTTQAKETYGFGTGRFSHTDSEGRTHDLTQLIDTDGVPLYDFAHMGQGAIPMAQIQRALSVCADDEAVVP